MAKTVELLQKDTPDEQAERYGRLAVLWHKRGCAVFAFANAQIAAHHYYTGHGRGRGIKKKIIPFVDTRSAKAKA